MRWFLVAAMQSTKYEVQRTKKEKTGFSFLVLITSSLGLFLVAIPAGAGGYGS